jgi:hypothetical protein
MCDPVTMGLGMAASAAGGAITRNSALSNAQSQAAARKGALSGHLRRCRLSYWGEEGNIGTPPQPLYVRETPPGSPSIPSTAPRLTLAAPPRWFSRLWSPFLPPASSAEARSVVMLMLLNFLMAASVARRARTRGRRWVRASLLAIKGGRIIGVDIGGIKYDGEIAAKPDGTKWNAPRWKLKHVYG